MADIRDGKFQMSQAARTWLKEQRAQRRERMAEEARATPENLTALHKEAGLVDEADPNDPRAWTVTQERVDKKRARVQFNIAVEAAKRKTREAPVRHLWFPENTVRKSELRDGNPPSDTDRPVHLRGLKLVIDVSTMSELQWLKVEYIAAQKEKRRAKGKSPTQILRGNRELIETLALRARLARG